MNTKTTSILIVAVFLSTTACSSYFDEQNRQFYNNLQKQAEERNVKACEKIYPTTQAGAGKTPEEVKAYCEKLNGYSDSDTNNANSNTSSK